MSQDNSQTNGEPAPDVETESPALLPDSLYGLHVDPEVKDVILKCTPCETKTVHDWTMAVPTDVKGMPAMEQMRRVIMCTHCGTVSVKK